jgi:hypothetical protein
MANTYKTTSVVGEHHFGDEPSEQTFTATEERDWLDGGHLALVPHKYRVLSDNYAAGEQGAEVELALLVEVEQALVSGGHLERIDPKPAKAAKKSADKSADKKTS